MQPPVKKFSEENKPKKYTITIKPGALKALRKIPKKFAVKIDELIRSLATNPRPGGCKKLEGYSNYYRIRYADYRVVYNVQDEKLVVDVISIGDRKEIYKGL